MARADIPTWTLVGVIIGMITSYLVSSGFTLIGAILGGIIGYLFGRMVR